VQIFGPPCVSRSVLASFWRRPQEVTNNNFASTFVCRKCFHIVWQMLPEEITFELQWRIRELISALIDKANLKTGALCVLRVQYSWCHQRLWVVRRILTNQQRRLFETRNALLYTILKSSVQTVLKLQGSRGSSPLSYAAGVLISEQEWMTKGYVFTLFYSVCDWP